MTSLENDPRIQKSLNALRGLGLKTQITKIDDNWLMIAITEDSIITAVKKLMERNISYNQFLILRDKETGFLTIHFWRGDMPSALRTKIWTSH